MKLYLAGNFVALSSPKKEKALYNKIIKYGSEYRRLITFYYQKEMMVALNLKKDMVQNNGQSQQTNLKIRKRLSSREGSGRENGPNVKRKMSLD